MKNSQIFLYLIYRILENHIIYRQRSEWNVLYYRNNLIIFRKYENENEKLIEKIRNDIMF